MSEATTHVARGSCSEVSERNGWTTFHVDVGSQYPVKLSTKLDPLIELGRAAAKDGGQFDWTYKEQESEKINEKSGKPYVNRYLDGVAAAGSAPAPSSEAKADVDWDAKERRDYRSRAWAQTISCMSHTIKVDESAGDIYRRLYALQRMIYRDIVRELDPETFPDDDVPF